MELYKIKDNRLVKFNGGFVVLNNRIYTNPSEEIVREVGYKDLSYDEKPEYDEATHFLVQELEEQETAIIVHWKVQEISLIEE